MGRYLQAFIFALTLFGPGLVVEGQPLNDTISLFKNLFEPDSRTNMVILERNNILTGKYTNLISNTNLVSQKEEYLLELVIAKYRNLTTNFLPKGSVLIDLDQTNSVFWAHYSYPNSGAREDIRFGNRSSNISVAKGRGYTTFLDELGPNFTIARFRFKEREGYDVLLRPPKDTEIGAQPMFLIEIRNGMPNGLFIQFHGVHFYELLHFVNGKAFGRWLIASPHEDGKILEIAVYTPVDYFFYMTQEVKN